MMFLVSAITGVALFIAQRNLTKEVANSLRREFEVTLTSLHNARMVRYAALTERCRALVRKPRIHAALEDNALDLLYPSAKDELRDVMDEYEPFSDALPRPLHAQFYRFLNSEGNVIPLPVAKGIGELKPDEESKLALQGAPHDQQLGYLARTSGVSEESMVEVITMPIVSTETGEVIAALAVGFKPFEIGNRTGLRGGIWSNGRLHLPAVSGLDRALLENEIARNHLSETAQDKGFKVQIGKLPYLVFYNLLNPGSQYPPAHEVCLFPLANLQDRQRQLRQQILGAGALMLIAGYSASHYFSRRLSLPVEKLAVDSERNRDQRERAEAALEQTHGELQRSVRFSADASHQLKTPLTVLRAGLEELLAREDLRDEIREEISSLIHQTYRLTGVVDDLLLLSRMDAGRLKLQFASVNLSQLLEAELDDLEAQPNNLEITVTKEFPSDLLIEGEKRYSMLIVRNLLENARKYNRQKGQIRLRAREDKDSVFLNIANTGQPIPLAMREPIFERFHRGAAGENVPGHGLGLNLARELARIHGGDLRLVRSDDEWIEFEAQFRVGRPINIVSSVE
ncbi:MAG: integral rane sensor signal transduction histidine kinase [Verrucomicrobiales bacterium]|nr:integral rane sensor signal transduction histidine kinase [Verrucomicrobiales bacterium]